VHPLSLVAHVGGQELNIYDIKYRNMMVMITKACKINTKLTQLSQNQYHYFLLSGSRFQIIYYRIDEGTKILFSNLEMESQ
jgi:hypothetical protein